MKKGIAIGLVFLLQVFSLALADTFIINGREITVPTPEVYVRVTDQMTAVSNLYKQMVDPMNDTLASYILASEVPAAMAGEMPSMERTCLLKVNKEIRNITIGKNDFSELKSVTKSQNQQIYEKIKSQVPETMQKMSEGLSQEFDVDFAMNVSQVAPLAPHYEAENAMSYSMYINYGISAGQNKSEGVVANTTTFLNASGTVLFLYSYAAKDDLDVTREVSRKWSESVLASNSEPPSKSPRKGIFDWGKIMEKGLIGGVAGGLIALIMGAITFLKRKNA